MIRRKQCIFFVIKCVVSICYIQTLVSAITVKPDTSTETLPKELLKEIDQYEKDIAKDLHPLRITREIKEDKPENENKNDNSVIISRDLLSDIKKETGVSARDLRNLVKREAKEDKSENRNRKDNFVVISRDLLADIKKETGVSARDLRNLVKRKAKEDKPENRNRKDNSIVISRDLLADIKKETGVSARDLRNLVKRETKEDKPENRNRKDNSVVISRDLLADIKKETGVSARDLRNLVKREAKEDKPENRNKNDNSVVISRDLVADIKEETGHRSEDLQHPVKREVKEEISIHTLKAIAPILPRDLFSEIPNEDEADAHQNLIVKREVKEEPPLLPSENENNIFLERHFQHSPVKRSIDNNNVDDYNVKESVKEASEYENQDRIASTYYRPTTIQATKTDGVVILATATYGGKEKKYTYGNNGVVTEHTLTVQNIRSSPLYNYQGYITGTIYAVTGINAAGGTEIDTASTTYSSSTYANYQDGGYTSPTQVSTPIPSYTKTAIYEDGFGTLSTVYFTIYDVQNFTDASAYSTFTTTDPSGNVITNTVTTVEVTISDESSVKTSSVTITGLGTVVTTTDFLGYPTVVTSVNEVTVSTDSTGGRITKTIPPSLLAPTPALSTSVQTIITTNEIGENVTTTTTVTGQGAIDLPETVTITNISNTLTRMESIELESSTKAVIIESGVSATQIPTFKAASTSEILITDCAGSTTVEIVTIVTDSSGSVTTLDSSGEHFTATDSYSISPTICLPNTLPSSSLDTAATASTTEITVTSIQDNISADKPSATSTSTNDDSPVTESETSTISVTDSSGSIITDSNGDSITEPTTSNLITDSSDGNGNPQTETVTDNQKSTTETSISVTDSSGNIVTDENENAVTDNLGNPGATETSPDFISTIETAIPVTDSSGNIATDENENAVTDNLGNPGATETSPDFISTIETAIPVTDSSGNIATDENENAVTDNLGNPGATETSPDFISTIETAIPVTDSSGNIATDENENAVTDNLGNPGATETSPDFIRTTETTVPVTDSSGNIVTDENENAVTDNLGNPGTTETSPDFISTTETTIPVTDSSGNIVTDENGNAVTDNLVNPGATETSPDFISTTETKIPVTDSSESTVTDDSGIEVTVTTPVVEGTVDDGTSGSVTVESNKTVLDYSKDNISEVYSSVNDLTVNLPTYGKKKCPYNKIKPFFQALPSIVESTGFALLWDAKQDSLLLTDRYASQVLKYSPGTGHWVKLLIAAKHVEAIIPTIDPDVYVIVVDNIIVSIETTFQKDGVIVKYKQLFVKFDSSIGFSVARTDPEGRLWLSVRYVHHGKERENLYMICNGKATIQETIIQRTGGMAWSPFKRNFYISDRDSRVIYMYECNKTSGNIQNRQVVIDFKDHKEFRGTPYDIAVDGKGGLWVAIFGSSQVIKINCVTWKIEKIIVLNTPYVVSLAFGEDTSDKLFVTSAFNRDPLRFPFIYTIGNTGVKRKNKPLPVTPSFIFGNNPMKIKIEGADPQPSVVSSIQPFIECEIPKKPFKKISKSCAFAENRPCIQATNTEITTVGLSPHFDKKKGSVFLADIFGPTIIRWRQSHGEVVKLTLKNASSVTTVIPIKGKSSQYIVAEDHRLVVLEHEFTKSATIEKSHRSIIAELAEPDDNIIFSIGKIDSKGRLWIGTMPIVIKRRLSCKLYILTKKSLKEVDSGFTEVGGMGWSPDMKTLYVADNGEGVIYRYAYNEKSEKISNKVVMFTVKGTQFENVTVSDLVVDSDNHIWVAIYGGYSVICITQSGEITRVVTIPDQYPTGLSFGGPNRAMYVSTARDGSTDCTEKNQGHLYVITNLGVQPARVQTDEFVL